MEARAIVIVHVNRTECPFACCQIISIAIDRQGRAITIPFDSKKASGTPKEIAIRETRDCDTAICRYTIISALITGKLITNKSFIDHHSFTSPIHGARP